MLPAFPFSRVLLALFLFGSAFGYLEAAVVVYLRALHEPLRQRFYPGRPPSDLFPLLTPDQVRTASPATMRIVAAELGREAATLAMLAAVALAVSRNAGQWAAAFALAFGVWDIAFYLGLKLLLGWPASLLTWDILFLIPVPWAGPVLAPVLVSAAMIGSGAVHLRREALGRPVRLGRLHWAGIWLGAAVIVLSFSMDAGNLLRGGEPRPFRWGVFAAGLAGGTLSYAAAARRRADGAPISS
jgi:hypothetical protein